MSVRNDLRSIFQELVEPELRSLEISVDAADRNAKTRHRDTMARFNALDRSLDCVELEIRVTETK